MCSFSDPKLYIVPFLISTAVFRLFFLLVFMCIFASHDVAMGQSAPSDEAQGIVIQRVGDSSPPNAGQGEAVVHNPHLKSVLMDEGLVLSHREALQEFYAARGFDPYWVDDSWFEESGDEDGFVAALEESWTHGLNPFSYHLEDIRALIESADGVDEARLEVLLSDAYISYGRDLSGIRIDPGPLKSHTRFWKQPYTAQTLLGFLDGRDFDGIARAFTPQGATYNRLRNELVALVNQADPPYEAVLPLRIEGLVKPYQEHRAMPDLRRRLGVGTSESLVYDDALAAAVMDFQKLHGLKADGILGPSTLERLNQTREDRIGQIIANLERLRWVEEDKPSKFVVVNIPSATVWGIEDGRVAVEMPVIVGRQKRPTNIFTTEITGVRFNPTWTVPPTIKKEDIVPKLVEDPFYLVSKGMELTAMGEDGRMSLDPSAIDWENVSEEELKEMRMVQTPGAHNPLGQVRIHMPNRYNIYLHDTNEKHLFERAGRAVSSGCVRMRAPFDMTSFILKDKSGWSEERQQGILADEAMEDIYLEETIPVYLVYYTAWMGEGDRVVYGNDLYGYDDITLKMLSDIDGFLIPVDNTGNKKVN